MEADDDESEDETKLIILIIGAISDLRAAAAGRGEPGVSRYHRVARARAQYYRNRKSRMSEYTNNAMLQGHAMGDVLTLCGFWITNSMKRNCVKTQYYHIWHHLNMLPKRVKVDFAAHGTHPVVCNVQCPELSTNIQIHDS